ncbi:hypothetical protein AJ80_07162 [Polytolypa hystricis UAMH7299]|uniref:Derlin n=1 Tax=Polytolypa hystricis (strain UAMH7299) TaxID=1447883 RepID=A0A2B7XRI7_POLH7|nr:hypothetical protein AJ80_07162 [Polytolypa hystricis UAMH7299]
MDVFWSAPPVSRTLTAATFVQSALVLSGSLDYSRIFFHMPWIFTIPPQIWRFVTPFLQTGPGLSFIFDLYFMYTYGSGLEQGSPRFTVPGDFFTYVVFVASVIMTTAGGLLGDIIFTRALILAFIYTFAQDNRGKKATFIIIQIPIEFLPWAMLTLTFVMGGPSAALSEGTGMVAAHLYDFLTRIYPTFGGGRNIINTPRFVKAWFGADIRAQAYRTYGTAYRPATGAAPSSRGAATPSSSSASASGSWYSGLGSNWTGRGAGRRLGSGS